MSNGDEPVLHALSVEPRSARAGETVRAVFRTRNLGTLPSPRGTVAFALGDGLDALDATEVAVEPVAPGDDVVAAIRARVAAPVDDGTQLVVRAALHVPDAAPGTNVVFGTNACTLAVRSRAVLGGPASGTFVEAVDAQTVRVRAVVTNEGDGPAHGVRLIVPAPIGCVRVGGEPATRDAVCGEPGSDGAALLERARLEAGERAELVFDARIVAPVAEVRADDGEVRFGDGRRVALPAREAVGLGPVIAPPRAVVVPARRRIELAIDVPNDGWADAHEVRVRTGLPPALRLVDGSVVVDGVPLASGVRARRAAARGTAAGGDGSVGRGAAVARVERDDDAYVFVVSAIAARSSVRVALAAAFAAACAGGTIAVAVDGHTLDVPFTPDHVRDVRVRVVAAPRTVSPGDDVRVAARIVNAGDVAEVLSFAIVDGASEATDGGSTERVGGAARTLAPGSVAVVELTMRVPADARDGAPSAPAVVVRDAHGERARAPFAVRVRDRAWLSVEEPPVCEGGCVRYVVRNEGSTTARDVAAAFDDVVVLAGAIVPGASAVVDVDEQLARRGGVLVAADREVAVLPRVGAAIPAVLYAALHAAAGVVAGAPFAVRLDLDVEDAVDALTVRVPAIHGAAYVPGSTSLDGRVLFDRVERGSPAVRSPLDAGGLTLRGVPAGTRVALAWSLIADPALVDEALLVAGTVDVNGEARAVAPVSVNVGARGSFAARPAGLAYHVEACTVVPASLPAPDVPAGPHAPASCEPIGEPVRAADVCFSMRFGAARRDEMARLAGGAGGRGLAGHLLVLRLAFPDGAANAAVCDALGALRDAVRDVFDRLFVKLRIPGFDVSSDDVEDAGVRRALVALFELLCDLTAGEQRDSHAAPAGFDHDTVRRTLGAIVGAPFGAPAVLRALVALLPERCDDDPALTAALRRYAALLDDVLSRYEGLPLELFDDALARLTDATLDDARDGILAALHAHAGDPLVVHGHAARVEPAC